MKRFFDRMSYRKVTLLRILSSESRVFSLNELVEYLNISKKTLVKSLVVLQDEIFEEGYPDSLIEKSNQGYFMGLVDTIAIKKIELNYLKSSTLFQLYNEIFNGDFRDITEFSLRHYLSYTSVYNRINESQNVLSSFKLQFGFNGTSILIGSELQIRYFYFKFYWASYWGTNWPFINVNREELSEIIEIMEMFNQKPLEIPEYEYALYWVAICISRNRSGYLIENKTDLDKALLNSQLFNSFKDELNEPVKKLCKQNILEEILFLFKVLLMSRGVIREGSFPIELLLTFQKENLIEYQLSSQWLSVFMEEYQLTFDVQQYNKFFTQLIYIHMKEVNFRGEDDLFISDFKVKQINNIPEMKFDEAKFADFFDTLENSELFSGFLESVSITQIKENYRSLIQHNLVVSSTEKKLRVVVITSLGTSSYEYLEGVIKQQTSFEIEFCTSSSIDVDLVIADQWYEQFDKVYKTTPITILESIPTLKDRQMLQKKFIEISMYDKEVNSGK
ncbi:helix-turn-helix domain-containing protein [Carnobacterium gallinarum]|uniref:helix-turn-helix domain-containing protein n=1 Tax=Carnobacterium gallinarum TaxID=2749 RepID=UPI000554D0AB|nr:helix-turn-helix domain-containing protein [Carnobacterium gallinarum]